MTICIAPGCERTDIKSRGYCNMHRQRLQRYGDASISKINRQHDGRCSIKGCDRPYMGRGLCQLHWSRMKRHGDPLKKVIRDFGTGSILRDGYIVIKRHGRSILFHRLLMEEHLGRPLRKDEVVHHIDCNPQNNALENLEVMPYRLHVKLHSLLATLTSLDERDLRHINNHLKRHGLTLSLQKSFIFVRVSR